MLEVFEPEALNYFTFSRPILLTFSVSRNPILTHPPLSGFLDSLLCALIAPTPGLAFSLLMPHTLAATSSFLSGSTYLFLNFLPLSSLDRYSDYVRVNVSFNNSSLLLFLNAYAHPIRSSPMDSRTDSFSPSILPSLRNIFSGTSIAITPSGTQDVLPNPAVRKYSTGSSLLTSSPLTTLTHPPFSIASLAVAHLLTFSLLPPLLLLGGASGPEL